MVFHYITCIKSSFYHNRHNYQIGKVPLNPNKNNNQVAMNPSLDNLIRSNRNQGNPYIWHRKDGGADREKKQEEFQPKRNKYSNSNKNITNPAPRQELHWLQPTRPSSSTSIINVTISNLALTVDQEDIEELFQDFKGALKVKLNTNSKGRSLGTAYALFNSRTDALNAVCTLYGITIDDKPLHLTIDNPVKLTPKPEVKASKRQSVFSRLSTIKVIVDNIALSVDQEDLEELFQEFKGVLKVNLNTDTKGRSQGKGYALFSRCDEALKCIDKYNKVPLDGEPLQISIEPQDESLNKKVDKLPKVQSVFSRLSKESSLNSDNQSQDDNCYYQNHPRKNIKISKRKNYYSSPEFYNPPAKRRKL